MTKELILSPIFLGVRSKEVAEATAKRLTENAIRVGGFVKEELQCINDGFMLVYAFPDNQKRETWKQLSHIE